MTTSTTTITAKVTDYTLEYPVQPPDYWTVEVNGREEFVSTEYDPESGELRFDPFSKLELTDEEADAVHDAIADEINGFNLELLAAVVRALLRDTFQAREYDMGGILDNFLEVPLEERIKRDSRTRAERIVREKLASGELKRTPSGGLIEGSTED